MWILPNDKKGLIEVANGKREYDLVIKNGKIVNVFTGEIYEGEVGIYEKHIGDVTCSIDEEREPLKGKKYYDAEGKYVIPGLIDAHIHIESTLLTPRNFAKAVTAHGTTTVVTDPHEIGNVHGIRGVKYMHDSSEGLPMRQYILAPSCVPSVQGLENAGAEFDEKDIEEMLDLERVIGIGEVMDFIGVIDNDERMVKIVEAAEKRNMFIQGHAPSLTGKQLSSYLCAGILSCHESRNEIEARDKMRKGMYVDARESSISKDVTKIVKGVKDFRYLTNLTLCTDDREVDEILTSGHMNDVVKTAVKAGLNPIDAIRCATLNNARELGIRNLGALAPGYLADIVVLEDFESFKVNAVVFEGEIVAEEGKLLKEIEDIKYDIEEENSVHVKELKIEDFMLKAPIEEGKIKTKIIQYRSQISSVTDFIEKELSVKDGYIDLSGEEDLKFVIVINRHGKDENKSIAVVKNFGLTKGALGSTISHDSHNLTIVYEDPKEALLVANDLIQMGGGLSCVENGELKEHLQLKVAGLMSNKEAEELSKAANKMKKAIRELGITEMPNPLLRVVTLALPVIPCAKMSDCGVVDVLNKKLVNIFE